MLQPVQLFKLLADETRSTIVMLLRSPVKCASVTSVRQPQSLSQISRHMALLREAELVIDRREGKWVHYRLSPHMPAWAAGIIDTAWNCERENIRNKLSSVASVSC